MHLWSTILDRKETSLTDQCFGPVVTPAGVRFRLWAPGASHVQLLLAEGGKEHPMRAEPDGFFEVTVPEAAPGVRYRFVRDDLPPLPDPASRFQPEGVHGWSEVVESRYDWQADAWRGLPLEELVIYELHVGTFTDGGTYQGVQEKLDHLAGLGITAVEVMPLSAFAGQRGWGYDGVFHFAPFAPYGRPDDLQALVDACHTRGIAVILDLVTNHFGPEGNAMWSLAPDFFDPHRPTSWSAGHAWELEPVMRYFDEAALHWIQTHRFDGLRLDAFHAVPKAARAEHLRRMVRTVDEHLTRNVPGRQVLFLLESTDNEAGLLRQGTERVRIAQLNFDFQRAGHALLTGERHGEYRDFRRPEQELGRCLGQGFAFRSRFNHHAGRVIGDGGKPERWGGLVNFVQNHDTCGNRHLGQRLDVLTEEPERLRAVTALLLLHPAIPFLFMGQEWGATTPFFFFTDVPEELGQATQQGRLRLFRELQEGQTAGAAPACQDPEAFARSVLRWDELDGVKHRVMVDLVREVLVVRRQVIPQMSRELADVELKRHDARYQLCISTREEGKRPFLLCSHLDTDPTPMLLPEGEVLYSTRPLEGEIPRFTTCLVR